MAFCLEFSPQNRWSQPFLLMILKKESVNFNSTYLISIHNFPKFDGRQQDDVS